jgi:glycosyltransferase involved in cell wall biosynthesis
LQKFSVIMSVYHKDSPQHFINAVDSIVNQVCKPAQIVIAVDGPVGMALESSINEVSRLPIIDVIRMKKNMGSGAIKRIAIEKVLHPIIAIMDSDDISVPTRFETQLLSLSDNYTEVVGGWIREFRVSPGDTRKIRKVPTCINQIKRFAKWRNPINHVSLMFTKNCYDRAGGYPSSRYCEDWELVVQMLLADSKIKNIPEVLVHVRAGTDMIIRRKKTGHLNAELALFHKFYKYKFILLHELILNILLRLIFSILPYGFTDYFYKVFLRR